MNGRLYVSRNETVDLREAIEALRPNIAEGSEAWVLVYAPSFCAFGRLKDGALEGPPERCFDDFHARVMTEAFEARLFCAGWELRWLREGKTGRAALLSDTPGFDLADFEEPESEKEARERLDAIGEAAEGTVKNTYLLWGERSPCRKDREGSDNGWTRLTTPRIGTLWVPYVIGKDNVERIQLTAREYWRREAHGNVAVTAERLTGFQDACIESGSDDR